jgi:hypothetical protein
MAAGDAQRMFAGIGLQVQWADRRPGRGAEPASTGCAPKRPEEIVVRIASRRTGSASREAFASALPCARTGARVAVFYGELREATRHQPHPEPVVLAPSVVKALR